jgi:hypothetical protein
VYLRAVFGQRVPSLCARQRLPGLPQVSGIAALIGGTGEVQGSAAYYIDDPLLGAAELEVPARVVALWIALGRRCNRVEWLKRIWGVLGGRL